MKTLSCDERPDPVDRAIRDMTPAEFVDWLIEYKGLNPQCRDNVESNLREQYKWHRIQGRLDRSPFWQFMAELLRVRRDSPLRLERPPKQEQ